LLNDPQYVEAARVLAERVIDQEPDAESRLTRAFRLVTSRYPHADELEVLTGLLDEQRMAFSADPTRAAELLAVGEWPRDRRIDAVEVASYAVVVNTMMSFDEAVIRR
jgi:hypothetical protein